MTQENGPEGEGSAEGQETPPPPSTAAQRALAEAAERRRQAEDVKTERPKEVGRQGPDPARYGDWEKKGIASDF